MINGLFLDPRAWKIDFTASPFWNPDKYGVHMDLHPEAFNIPKLGIDPKYKFVIATEVWEIPMRKTLQYLRDKGLKVFLIAREPIKYGDSIKGMFSYARYFFNNEYYFKPDAVFGAGKKYTDIWEDKTKTHITGYPRWDWYVDQKQWKSRDEVFGQYGLEKDRKVIFFPSYPPYTYEKSEGKDIMVDLFETREGILRVASEFAKNNPEYQLVSKIHPMSMKCYRKGTGTGKEVSGLIKKYFKSPTNYFKVIGDERMSGSISKEIMIHSDLIVGFFSTMLLEAVTLRKPAIQALIGKESTRFFNPYENMFPTANTEEELRVLLDNFDAKSYTTSEFAVQQTTDYMYHVDTKACERICSAIKEEMNK